MRVLHYFVLFFLIVGCQQKIEKSAAITKNTNSIHHAKGFSIASTSSGITIIKISHPWPDAKTSFKYALIPKLKRDNITLDSKEYDAVIYTPLERLVVTSTTHLPAIELLGVLDKLKGFPTTDHISSKKARALVKNGTIKDLGNVASINTELTLAVKPEVLIAFGVNGQNKAYNTLQAANIPIVYNGDWAESTPLGKAEWIKFFAPFFQKEKKADSIFSVIENSYKITRKLAKTAVKIPTVLSGAMHKDIWYLPGGNSWAAAFLKDANAYYLWRERQNTGSLALSWEHVLKKGRNAEFWIAPAQFTSYTGLEAASDHYKQFTPFKNKKIYTFSKTVGATGSMLYYELASQRPDIVLKDLVHILHPNVLPNYKPFFFKPLDL